jgi:hypothetical protein
MNEIDWLDLTVGDRVRVVEVPQEFLQDGYYVDPDTLAVYQHLAGSAIELEILEIDVDGIPWGEFEMFREDLPDQPTEHHRLALNHGGISMGKRR